MCAGVRAFRLAPSLTPDVNNCMYVKISDSETGKEKEWDVPDWLVVAVLSGALTGVLLLVI